VNATGEMQSSTLQTFAAALPVLAYGLPSDEVDEYARLADSNTNETVHRFTRFVVEKYKPLYLLEPTRADLQRIMDDYADAGSPGCMGCVDCSHWVWKMCPVAFHGQYQGKSKKRSIVMETVADKDLYLWHFYIGLPGTINQLNTMAFSPFFNSITFGSFLPPIPYTVNGVERTLPYVLCDGIYPKWAVLVNTSDGEREREKYSSSFQEGKLTDAERVYAYLLQEWNILEQPARFRLVETLVHVRTCCAVLNNMIVSHRRKEPAVPQPGMWGAALLTFFFSPRAFLDYLRFLAQNHMFPAPEN